VSPPIKAREVIIQRAQIKQAKLESEHEDAHHGGAVSNGEQGQRPPTAAHLKIEENKRSVSSSSESSDLTHLHNKNITTNKD